MTEQINNYISTDGLNLLVSYGTKLIFALLILFVGLWVIKIIKRLITSNLSKIVKDEVLVGFLSSLSDWLLKIVTVYKDR